MCVLMCVCVCRALMSHCLSSRLFQSLAKHRQLSKVQSVLLGQVSLSCFLLQDCSAANRSANTDHIYGLYLSLLVCQRVNNLYIVSQFSPGLLKLGLSAPQGGHRVDMMGPEVMEDGAMKTEDEEEKKGGRNRGARRQKEEEETELKQRKKYELNVCVPPYVTLPHLTGARRCW